MKRWTGWLICLCLGIQTALAQSQATLPEGVTVIADQSYISGGTASQKLDIYLPAGYDASRSYPVILAVHGGGWAMGDKAFNYHYMGSNTYAAILNTKEYILASANYTLVTETANSYPTAVNELKQAVAYLQNVTEAGGYTINIDPDRIGAWGGSAGGNLVEMLGAQNVVSAVASNCGEADLRLFLNPDGSFKDGVPYYNKWYFGAATGAETLEKAIAASPITYIDGNDSAFLLIHGTVDTTVPYQSSVLLNDAVKAVNGKSELISLGGTNHDGQAFVNQSTLSSIVAFFNENLRGINPEVFRWIPGTTTADYSLPTNWEPGFAPGYGDVAEISGGTNSITLMRVANAQKLQISGGSNTTVGSGGTYVDGGATLTIGNATLTSELCFIISETDGDSEVFVNDGGVLNVNSYGLHLGWAVQGTGRLTINTGGTVNAKTYVRVGEKNQGELNVHGGTLQVTGTAGEDILSVGFGKYGKMSVHDGTVSVMKNLFVGNLSKGEMFVSGKSYVTGNGLVFGYNAEGNVSVAGESTVESTAGMFIGLNGPSVVTLKDDAKLVSTYSTAMGVESGYIKIGATANGSGTVVMSGRSQIVATGGEPFYVGVNNSGVGRITASENAVIKTEGGSSMVIGGNTARGFITLNDSANVAVSGSMTLGSSTGGYGELTLNDSARVTVNGSTILGSVTGSSGELTLNDTSYVEAGNILYIGGGSPENAGGKGVVNVSGGELTATYILVGSTAKATLSLSGGKISTRQNFNIGVYRGGNGDVTISGGTLSATGMYLGLGDVSGSAALGPGTGILTLMGNSTLNLSGAMHIASIDEGVGTLNLVGATQGATNGNGVKWQAGSMDVGAEGTVNFLASAPGLPTLEILGTADLTKGTYNMGVWGGVAAFNQTADISILKAGTLSGWTDGKMQNSGLWNISASGNNLVASLDPSKSMGVIVGEFAIELETPSSAGWLEVRPTDAVIQLELKLTGDGDIAALAQWMNAEFLKNPDTSSSSAMVGEDSIVVHMLRLGGSNVLGWDFNRYNAENGTSFAVTSVAGVPEPASGTLWVLCLAMIWVLRRKKH